MFVDLWISFLGSILSFSPFVQIVAAILAVCVVLLIRSLKVW